jgi:hypothetical protein
MKTYHEIFLEPGGSWMARIYSDDVVVETLVGVDRSRDAAKHAAVRAVTAWHDQHSAPVTEPGTKRPWWRFW